MSTTFDVFPQSDHLPGFGDFVDDLFNIFQNRCSQYGPVGRHLLKDRQELLLFFF